MIGASDTYNALYGVGNIEVEGDRLENVPLCFDFRTGRLGYQFCAAMELFKSEICFEKIAYIDGIFPSPWGVFELQAGAQWTSYSFGGGGWSAKRTPLSVFINKDTDWSWRWLSTNQEVHLTAPYSHSEVLLVGRSRPIHTRVEIGDGLYVIPRKSSLSIIGEMDFDDIYPLYSGVASIAVGAALRPHSYQNGHELTLFRNRYFESEHSSNTLHFSGYPMTNPNLEVSTFESVWRSAREKLASNRQDGEPGVHEILQYLDARTSSVLSESKVLTAFSFLETFCVRHLKKSDYETIFGLNSAEAEAMNRYRNDLIHNNLDPVSATQSFEGKIRNCGSCLVAAMRDDVKAAPSLFALNYVMSVCDKHLLDWIGYGGLCQMYIPTMETPLREWQSRSQGAIQ